MNCILRRNPYSGLGRSHKLFCLWCDEDATLHFNNGSCCGNVCERCAKRKFKPQEIEAGVFVERTSDDTKAAEEWHQPMKTPPTWQETPGMTLPLSNTTLEIAFNNLLLREATPIEREFLRTHPELYTYAFLCFVRGCDWTNARYTNIVEQAYKDIRVEDC